MNNTQTRILPAGTVLHDTYRIVRDYGAGSGGIVYLAEHLRLDKTVIVKQMKAEVSHVLDHKADVENLKNLHHSYLPQVYDLLAEEGGVYTVMEFIEGKTLGAMLEEGRKFRQSEVVRWGTQLAEVVNYLHTRARPIIHRDIKPDNIIITPGGDICLIDFNVAFALGEDQRFNAHTDGYAPIEQYAENVRKGKPMKPTRGGTAVAADAAAPADASIRGTMLDSIIKNTVMDDAAGSGTVVDEQMTGGTILDDPLQGGTIADDPLLDGKLPPQASSQAKAPAVKISSVDGRADIYSIGATLYHLALGVMPAPATEKVKPVSAYENAHLGDALTAIIEKCMQRDRAKRYQTAAALYRAFLDIKKNDSRYRRFRFRYNLASAVIAVMLIVSAAMTGYGWRLMQSESGSRFDALVSDAREASMAGDFDGALAYCDEADSIRAGTPHVMAERLVVDFFRLDYKAGYDRAAAFADVYIPREDEYAAYADVLYTAGLCAMQMNRMEEAAALIDGALTYYNENPEYYCDLAIALARLGDAAGAREMLGKAQALGGAGEARIALVSGEVALAEGVYPDALTQMRRALNAAESEYERYRAYMLMAVIYGAVPDDSIEDGVTLLGMAADEFYGTAYENSLRLVTADLAAKAAQRIPTSSVSLWRTALAHYTVIISEGYADYQTTLNASLAAMEVDEFSAAHDMLLPLTEQYPADYRAWKLLAFLTVEMENLKAVETRDYAAFTGYYDKACSGYAAKQQSTGGFFDTEMQMLERLAGDLKNGGWIK